MNLLDPGLFKGNDREIYEHLMKTVDTMEDLFKDLSEIIELRHELYSVRDKIDIKAEVENIKNLLKKDILSSQAEINVDDRLSEHFYSNKLKLHSILYNLINNALKYRHNHRIPVIDIRLTENDTNFYIASGTTAWVSIWKITRTKYSSCTSDFICTPKEKAWAYTW